MSLTKEELIERYGDYEQEYRFEVKVNPDIKRQFFKDKAELLSQYGTEATLDELIRTVFPESMLQDATLQKGETDGNGCGLITTRKTRTGKNGELKVTERRYLIKNDYAGIKRAVDRCDSTALIFPFTVFGKRHRKQNAHELHAIVVDIDYVWKWHMENILHQCYNTHRIPVPYFITSSGNGVHLWYLLDLPYNMTQRQGQELLKLKRMMMRFLWDEWTSAAGNDRDGANIYQGFRPPGVYTKLAYGNDGNLLPDADDYKATCYRMKGAELYSIRDLYKMFPDTFERFFLEEHGVRVGELRGSDLEEAKKKWIPNLDIIDAKFAWQAESSPSTYTKEQCRELFPEWSARTFDGAKPKKNKGWTCSPKLYKWWLDKIEHEAKVKHRYWCIRALAQYGVKCGIPKGQIRKDAYSLLELFDSRSTSMNPSDRFTAYDIECALSTMYQDITIKKESTRAFIEEWSGITIPPCKRNGKKREWHLEDMRERKAKMKKRGEPFKRPEGRPKGSVKTETKASETIKEWRKINPNGRKADCIRDTGLTKPTVYKWWDSCLEKIAGEIS